MELANIEQLVEKYLNAETTLQEETTLSNYFASNNVAPHLQEYSYMFNYFKQSKDETFTKNIQLKPSKPKKNWKWLSVAASVALLVSVYVGYGNYQQKQKEQQQFAQVQDALKLLSVNLNKGDKAVASLYTYENTVNKIFKTK